MSLGCPTNHKVNLSATNLLYFDLSGDLVETTHRGAGFGIAIGIEIGKCLAGWVIKFPLDEHRQRQSLSLILASVVCRPFIYTFSPNDKPSMCTLFHYHHLLLVNWRLG